MSKQTNQMHLHQGLISMLPPFSGTDEENVEYFVKSFKDIANAEKWPQSRQIPILRLCVRGKALQYLMENEKVKEASDLSEVLKLLQTKFAKKKNFEENQREFVKLKQVQGQSVKNLAEEIEQVTAKYVAIKDQSNEQLVELANNLKLTKFLEALRTDIRVEVRKLGPRNFNEAVKMAKNVETALEDSNKSDFDSQKIVENLEVNHIMQTQAHCNLVIENLKTEIESLKKQIAKTEEKVTCHICNKSHLTTACWYYPTAGAGQVNDVRNFQMNDRGFVNNRRNFNGGVSRFRQRGQRFDRGNSQRRGNRGNFKPYDRNQGKRGHLNG